MFEQQKPSIRFSMVGFGQAGSRIANEFGKFKFNEETAYNVFAFNSTSRDFSGLNNIPKSNQVSMELDGFGKEPSKAYQLLRSTPEHYNRVENMVDKAYETAEELLIFNSGLGGGTGTSTILLAIQIFIKKYVNDVIEKHTKLMLEAQGFEYDSFMVEHGENEQVISGLYAKAAHNAERAGELKKLGLILAYPKRSDGPGVLKEVNRFIQQIWDLQLNPQNRISFILPVDNQKAADIFSERKSKLDFNTYRDYINYTVASMFHEINCATNIGGSDVTFDAQDFRKCILEHQGILVIGKKVLPAIDISNSDSLFEALSDAWENGHTLHDKIEWEVQQNGTIAYNEVYNVGVLTIVKPDVVIERQINTSYLDEAQDYLSKLRLVGDCKVFTGQIETKEVDSNVYAYIFAKTTALPERLSTGLVEEFLQYKERTQKDVFVQGKIEQLKDFTEPEPKKAFKLDDPFAKTVDDDLSDLLKTVPNNSQDQEKKEAKKKEDFLKSLVNTSENPFGF
ncbi:cell division protein FtsZ [Bacillus anthracis]|uniref:cell division protein FtsZ n=1 Tax=Bacillus cereus TaxID=1396 RepID=UPI000BF89F16|nr:cell division protein FtsZ [Bacillus anthracis]